MGWEICFKDVCGNGKIDYNKLTRGGVTPLQLLLLKFEQVQNAPEVLQHFIRHSDILK
jgi:hypothetical protein